MSYRNLPTAWLNAGKKQETVIAHLNGHVNFAPEWWLEMRPEDRHEVILFLKGTGQVSKMVPTRPWSHSGLGQYVDARDPPAVQQANEERKLHGPPNGRQRRLPSVYTTLTDYWLRSNGTPIRPQDMDENHIHNCLALLKESHVNHLESAARVLELTTRHFRHRPYIVELAVRLHKEIETYDVDEMYPIWGPLCEELDRIELQTEPNKASIDALRASLHRAAESIIEDMYQEG